MRIIHIIPYIRVLYKHTFSKYVYTLYTPLRGGGNIQVYTRRVDIYQV